MTFMLTSCQNNFDHEVTQEAPGNGPQSKSNIQSKAGVPMVRLNNGVYMPRFGFGTKYYQWKMVLDKTLMPKLMKQ